MAQWSEPYHGMRTHGTVGHSRLSMSKRPRTRNHTTLFISTPPASQQIAKVALWQWLSSKQTCAAQPMPTIVHCKQVPLEDSLTYIADENGSTDGWKTQYFRELQDSNKTLPVSLVDVLKPDPAAPTDYKLAVYLYDMEENPIACATLEPASEEEAKMYSDMFYGEDDVPDAETVNSLGDDTSAGGLELVSTIVTGLSLFASAMLIFV
eukprot:scaffold4099_cov73-Skeletonema_dohrnii-CCMP3373.AAC.1